MNRQNSSDGGPKESAWTSGKAAGSSESSFSRAADPVEVATRGLNGVQPVVVVDVHMRFWSMVVFMVKAALASIPAMLILFFFYMVLGGIFVGSVFAQSACANYSSSQLRTFVIQKTIKAGMTSAQVKRVWGDPTKIRSAHPGGDEWEYWNPSGDQVVTFGPEGCVTGWYTHRD